MPSPLGEGQADMPINRLHLGEVIPSCRLIVTIWVKSNTPSHPTRDRFSPQFQGLIFHEQIVDMIQHMIKVVK